MDFGFICDLEFVIWDFFMIIGHKRQTEYFQKVLAWGALAHAYLFFGPEHVGKRAFAEGIAKAILCEKMKLHGQSCGISPFTVNPAGLPVERNPAPKTTVHPQASPWSSGAGRKKGIEACQSCEKVEGGRNEHITVLSVSETLISKKEERKDIPIEDIRELKRMLSFAPAGNAWRVVIIDGAERMSAPAANAFLKILEEPPGQTIFFLISPDPEHVLATIRSRAQGIYFSLVSSDDIGEFLMGESVPKSRLDDITAVSAGRAGVAVLAIRNKSEFEEEKKFLESVASALSKGAPHFFPFTERAASDEETRARAANEVLRILEGRMQEEEDIGRALAIAKKVKNVVRIVDVMTQTNVNPRMSLDLIFMEGAGT